MAKEKISEEELKKLLKQHAKDVVLDNKNPNLKYLIKTKDMTIEIYNTNTIVYRSKQKYTNQKTNNKILFSDQLGSDETGTGDLFGPVIFAAAYIDDHIINKLSALDCYELITDSKKISDINVAIIYQQIKDIVPHFVFTINPAEFNPLNDKYNLNEIKTIGHLTVLNKLSTKHQAQIYIDAFCTKQNFKKYIEAHNLKIKFNFEETIFETKAESKYASVAIASIFARYFLIQWFNTASREVGFDLPMGAGKNTVDMYNLLKRNYISVENYTKLSWKSIK